MGSEALQVSMPAFPGSRLLRTGSVPSAAPGTREVRSAATARTLNQICLNSFVPRSSRL
jgi:hypothetical protein